MQNPSRHIIVLMVYMSLHGLFRFLQISQLQERLVVFSLIVPSSSVHSASSSKLTKKILMHNHGLNETRRKFVSKQKFG